MPERNIIEQITRRVVRTTELLMTPPGQLPAGQQFGIEAGSVDPTGEIGSCGMLGITPIESFRLCGRERTP